MRVEYFTDPKFKRIELIKSILFIPIFGSFVILSNHFSLIEPFILIIGSVIILIAGLWLFNKSFSTKASIIIDDSGLIINNPYQLPKIDWEEIEQIRIQQSQKRKLICIDLKDPNSHKSKTSFLILNHMKISERQFNTHVVVMDKYVSFKTDEIVLEINKRINPTIIE